MVRQFLNVQRVGPIGMSEKKDADELAAESGQELPRLPPIPLQIEPSSGIPCGSQCEPGGWCCEHGITRPPGSFGSDAATAQVPAPSDAGSRRSTAVVV